MDPKGLAFGRSHITISTSGCVDGIDRLVDEGEYGPNLAVSVNAPEDAVRNKLMPINRKHNMQQLYQSMDNYCKKTGREILIAYVLLKGQNDTLEHADRLADYLRGLNVKINLIPYNPQSRDRFQPPEPEVLEAVTQRLRGHGYYTLLRLTKGSKIMAACGQLGNLELRKKRSNSFHIN
jgi:23S rRNA (adenine2503-C2)-methyltransferase